MKRYLTLFALLLLPMLAWGQGNTVTLSGSGAPSGGCAFIMRYIDIVGQVEYACDTSGNWFQVGPGAAGATSLSSVTNPTGNKSFDMQTYSLVWNWATGNTSTTNLFSVADNATNTGTGYLFTISSGSGSTTKPFRVCYRGTSNCINMDTTTLTTSGTAVIDATKLSGNLPALDGSSLTNVNAVTLLTKTWASPAAIGTGTPAAATFTTITGNTSLTTPFWTVAESAVANGSGTTTWNVGVDSTSHRFVCKNSLGTSCLPSGTPAGASNDVQFNTSGAFAADTGVFTYDPSTHQLSVGSGGIVASGATVLTPTVAGGGSIGSSSLPFQYIYFAGDSGTPASNNGKILGTFTAARQFTFPDASGTVQLTTTTPTVTLTTTTPISVSSTAASAFYYNQHATAGTAVTYNLPTAAAGKQFCFANSYNGSAANTGALTIATSAAGQYIIYKDGTLSASGGNVASGGAGGDSGCVVGVDATHWQWYPGQGTWTKN